MYTPPPLGSVMNFCTTDLPYVVTPTVLPRLLPWIAAAKISPPAPAELPVSTPPRPCGGREGPAGQQRGGRGARLVDAAAGVAAHVDDQLARPALAHVLERRAELLRRSLLEERHLDVGHAVELLRRQRHWVELRRLDRDLVALGLPAAEHLQVHRMV